MAEVAIASSSDSDDELALEVLSGFVKTVYNTVKEEGALSPNESVTQLVEEPGSEEKSKKQKEAELFQDLLSHAAKSLDLKGTEHETDYPTAPGKEGQDLVLIPLDDAISQKCNTVWQKPVSVTPVHWAMQRKYYCRGEDTVLTTSHPLADSVMVFAASGGRTTKAENFPIPGNEPKSLEVIGKRVYQSGGLALKQANVAAVMSRYNQHLWSQLSDLLEGLPEDSKNKALEIQQEGLALATSGIQVAHEQADVAARAMTTGILQRRRVWFNLSEAPLMAESKVLDLPFDGRRLFHPSTGEVVERIRTQPSLGGVLRRVNYLRPPNRLPKRRKRTQPQA